MPLIEIDGIGGTLSRKQKEQLVSELTEKASEIMDIPEGAFMVLIKEMDFENIGSNGKLLDEE